MKSKCYHTCEYSHTSRSPKPFSPTLMGSATSFCPALDEKQPNTHKPLVPYRDGDQLVQV